MEWMEWMRSLPNIKKYSCGHLLVRCDVLAKACDTFTNWEDEVTQCILDLWQVDYPRMAAKCDDECEPDISGRRCIWRFL